MLIPPKYYLISALWTLGLKEEGENADRIERRALEYTAGFEITPNVVFAISFGM
jgi:hypothetical protein